MNKIKLHPCPYCGHFVAFFRTDNLRGHVRCSNSNCCYTGPFELSLGEKHNELCDLLKHGKAFCERVGKVFPVTSFPNSKEGWVDKVDGRSEEKRIGFAVYGGIEMLDSLKEAVKDAGGDPSQFSASKLDKMTVMEMVALLGCNGIRFYYLGGPKAKEE